VFTLSRRRTLRALCATVGTVAAMFLVQVAAPGTAHAKCEGEVEVAAELTLLGVTYGRATPRRGTCNGNNYYQIDFQSLDTDWRATFAWQNNSKWSKVAGGYNTSMLYASFTDNNNNTEILFCVDNEGTVSAGEDPTYICGGWDGILHVTEDIDYTAGVITQDF
jgi:hypothetical protein